jgi:hypothetical protein
MYEEDVDFEVLIGKTIKEIKVFPGELLFITDDGKYLMKHNQCCCESVYLEDICGDLNDLIGSKVVTAKVTSNSDKPPLDDDDSFTWTFYDLTTIHGAVTFRWYGSSNGYYSEEVDFYRIIDDEEHNELQTLT